MHELNPHGYKPTDEQWANLQILHERMNLVRKEYGKPMIVTSGLRSEADQARINPKAPKSKHLLGLACDIYDPGADLYRWCKAHEDFLTANGLWMEERQGPWQHFQAAPPRSGKRWFIP